MGLGRSSRELIEVEAGLREGDRVILSDLPQWDRSLNNLSGDPAEARIATQAVVHTDAHPSAMLLPLLRES